MINQLSSRSSKKSVNISEIKTGEKVINTPSELAQTFNLHFSNIGQNLAAEIPNVNVVPESYMKPTQHRFSLKAPTASTVCKLLENVNVRKAAGLDGVSNKLLKFAAHIVAPSLTKIFTKSINTGIFPTERKIARVTPIFKKGKKNDLNNYRPISVIPTVAKIFEKLVYDQLFSYFNDNKLLTSHQSGFRSFHSTLTALTEATNTWAVNIDNGLLNGVVFLDLKKAFDTIDHSIILRKLKFYGIEQETLKWFQSYIFMIGNKYAVSMDTCRVRDQFHVGFLREATLAHYFSLYILTTCQIVLAQLLQECLQMTLMSVSHQLRYLNSKTC